MAAATRVIASQGLSAPTATIAKEAGVSNGSLFNYFETKADLLNQLYIELKMELATRALSGLPTEKSLRDQMLYMWSNWLDWALVSPEKRRALTHLLVSDDITPQSHKKANETFSGIRDLMNRCRENGPMRDVSLDLVIALMSALADATIDFMLQDSANADQNSMAAFEAFWRMVA